MRTKSLCALLLGGFGLVNAYQEGVYPLSFEKGDAVHLKVNKLTSTKMLFPMNYYNLPFCMPEGGPRMDNLNIGEFLAGDRIQNSPYRIRMLEDVYCENLCSFVFDHHQSKKFAHAIRMGYHNNWILDNLPSASKMENDEMVITRYWQGFPIGYMDEMGKTYVNNHVNIEIHYHAVESDIEKYRIVRFTVEPFSIDHENKHPIESCLPNAKIHTTFEMITDVTKNQTPQLASGNILFTYDVIWIENRDLKWSSRWDIYLSMDNAIPFQVHWMSITNSLVVAFVLSSMIAAILIRNLRNDYERYGRLATENEKPEDLEELGWKLVHGDVFRPPSFSPLLLSVMCGTGAQLLCTACLVIFLALLGFVSFAKRGSVLISIIACYVLMGGVSGYVMARLNKIFGGDDSMCKKGTILGAFGFQGLVFGFFVMMNFVGSIQQSTIAVPFATMIALLVHWLGISTPLVLFGAFVGNQQPLLEVPLETNSLPKLIPDQPWYMNNFLRVAVGGVLPFGSIFVELYFIMTSMWFDQYYNTFGCLFLVFAILIITCAEMTILFCYFQLSGGNYHWWWSSFCTAGSLGLYVLFYSTWYGRQLELSYFSSHLFYFGYMALISLALFLMMGFVGVSSSLWFNKTLYGTMKSK